jgi:AhpD family alkylhydroperoxidase
MDSLDRYLQECGLEKSLLLLIQLRASQINGCAYCIDLHSRELLAGGLAVEHLVLVAAWREAGTIFGEQERTALAWAEDVTRLGDCGVQNDAFNATIAVFGEKPLVDLTLAIALMNAYNRIAISFRATPMAVAR